jgi:hypothetical protein
MQGGGTRGQSGRIDGAQRGRDQSVEIGVEL